MSVPWEVVASFIGLIIFWGGIMIGAIRWLLSSYQREMNRHLDQRFGSLEKSMHTHMKEVNDVRGELKDFKTEVARSYIDRETFIRVEGGRDVSLRTLNERVERIAEKLHADPPQS